MKNYHIKNKLHLITNIIKLIYLLIFFNIQKYIIKPQPQSLKLFNTALKIEKLLNHINTTF